MDKTPCSFTGYRPKSFPWKYDETAPGCILLKEVLAAQISALPERGVTDWLSGMAQGVDLWCAQIVLDLRQKNPVLKLRCILPHEGQADRWSDSARERYCSILQQADSVDYVRRQNYDGCMIDRNHRLACCWLFSTECGAAAPGQQSAMPGSWAGKSSALTPSPELSRANRHKTFVQNVENYRTVDFLTER